MYSLYFSGYLRHFRVKRMVQGIWGFLYGCVCKVCVKLTAEEREGIRGLKKVQKGEKV